VSNPDPANFTPRELLEALNGIKADGFGLHSVVDVEASASGEVLRSETVVQPGGGAGPLHRHRFQEERFQILEGQIVGLIGRKEVAELNYSHIGRSCATRAGCCRVFSHPRM